MSSLSIAKQQQEQGRRTGKRGRRKRKHCWLNNRIQQYKCRLLLCDIGRHHQHNLNDDGDIGNHYNSGSMSNQVMKTIMLKMATMATIANHKIVNYYHLRHLSKNLLSKIRKNKLLQITKQQQQQQPNQILRQKMQTSTTALSSTLPFRFDGNVDGYNDNGIHHQLTKLTTTNIRKWSSMKRKRRRIFEHKELMFGCKQITNTITNCHHLCSKQSTNNDDDNNKCDPKIKHQMLSAKCFTTNLNYYCSNNDCEMSSIRNVLRRTSCNNKTEHHRQTLNNHRWPFILMPIFQFNNISLLQRIAISFLHILILIIAMSTTTDQRQQQNITTTTATNLCQPFQLKTSKNVTKTTEQLFNSLIDFGQIINFGNHHHHHNRHPSSMIISTRNLRNLTAESSIHHPFIFHKNFHPTISKRQRQRTSTNNLIHNNKIIDELIYMKTNASHRRKLNQQMSIEIKKFRQQKTNHLRPTRPNVPSDTSHMNHQRWKRATPSIEVIHSKKDQENSVDKSKKYHRRSQVSSKSRRHSLSSSKSTSLKPPYADVVSIKNSAYDDDAESIEENLKLKSSTLATTSMPISIARRRDYSNENFHYTNITAQVGHPAYMPCVIDSLGDKMVSWIRLRDFHLLTIGSLTYIQDDRFAVRFGGYQSNDWVLQIKHVTVKDEGLYECQINSDPPKSQYYYLHIVVPQTEIIGNPNIFVRLGESINLTCLITSSPEPPAFVFWYHNERMINYDYANSPEHGHINVQKSQTQPDTIISRLVITKAKLQASGNYTCSPSNSEPASTYVHVLQGEKRLSNDVQNDWNPNHHHQASSSSSSSAGGGILLDGHHQTMNQAMNEGHRQASSSSSASTIVLSNYWIKSLPLQLRLSTMLNVVYYLNLTSLPNIILMLLLQQIIINNFIL